jgi:hypothetical protein
MEPTVDHKPVDGGAYYQDEAGTLVRLEEGQYQLNPATRELQLVPTESPPTSPPEA